MTMKLKLAVLSVVALAWTALAWTALAYAQTDTPPGEAAKPGPRGERKVRPEGPPRGPFFGPGAKKPGGAFGADEEWPADKPKPPLAPGEEGKPVPGGPGAKPGLHGGPFFGPGMPGPPPGGPGAGMPGGGPGMMMPPGGPGAGMPGGGPGMMMPPGGPGRGMPGGMPGMMMPPGPPDPEMQELDRTEGEVMQQCAELAMKFRQTPKAEREALKKQLAEVVNRHFDLRQKRRDLQLKRLEEELQRLREASERRTKAREEIVNRRIAELLGEQDDLGF